MWLARETLTASHAVETMAPLSFDDVKGQLVEVYDTTSGMRVLTTPASPVLDGGGNVAISPTGKRVAVLNAGAIQVFELPAPAMAASGDGKSVHIDFGGCSEFASRVNLAAEVFLATAVVHYTAAAVTDRGRKRPSNEDAFGFSVEAGVYVVCDGMGGAAAGEIASNLAVDEVLRLVSNRGGDDHTSFSDCG